MNFNQEFINQKDEQFMIIEEQVNAKIQILDESIPLQSAPHVSSRHLNLPRIEIKKFDGKPKHCLEFSDIFKRIYHDDTGLSGVEKFTALKPLLIGDAAQFLSAIPVTEANYTAAWESLLERFNNPRVQLNVHIDAIKEINTHLTTKGAQELRRIHGAIKENLIAISTMNLNTNTLVWVAVIGNLILEKLDYPTNMAFEQSLANPKEIPTIK